MAEIAVRNIRFDFDEELNLDCPDEMLTTTLSTLAVSLTLPYLEPYLIRTMKVALKQISDPTLAEDARRFSQQEGHHYRNHAVFNRKVHACFDDRSSGELRVIESALEADYQRFTRSKSLRFNVTYAEGFEAMTCAAAMAMVEHGVFEKGSMIPAADLWAWHVAEEIEHRTVAFEVFEDLVGWYPYRLLVGGWAQWHYLSFIRRLAIRMAEALGRELLPPRSEFHRSALRRYLRTWSPRYHPARLVVPPSVARLLSHYSAMAPSAGAH